MVNALKSAGPGPKKAKMDLTPEAFAFFLRWLSEDDRLATQQYFSIEQRLTKFFVRKGCLHSDELFDKTVNVLVRKLQEGTEIQNRLSFFYGVAQRVWWEYLREEPSLQSIEGKDIPAPPPDPSPEPELQCLETCMNALTPGDRELFIQYHEGQGRERIENRKRLARTHGGENTTRIKVFRIRRKLHECVSTCIDKKKQ